MSRGIPVLFAVAVLAVAPPARADDKLTAQELLKKAIDAAGGAEALKKYPAMTEKGKGVMDLDGAEATFTSNTMLTADSLKMAMTIEFAGMKATSVFIVNGEKTLLTTDGREIPLDEAQKALLREEMEVRRVLMLLPILDNPLYDFEVQAAKAKVGDSEAYVLTVKSRDLRPTKVFFDAKTFLIAKVEKPSINYAQKEVKQEVFPTDYRKINGILVPMKARVLHDGKRYMDLEELEIKVLEKIPSSEFKIGD